jgi:hypothetical protein
MKFKKEIKIVIEGETFDESIDPIEIFKNLNFTWKHWWQNDPNWIYGTPSEIIQKCKIEKIFLDDKEIKNNM